VAGRLHAGLRQQAEPQHHQQQSKQQGVNPSIWRIAYRKYKRPIFCFPAVSTYLFETNAAAQCRLDEIVSITPAKWRPVPPLAAAELLEQCLDLAGPNFGFEASEAVVETLEHMAGQLDPSLPAWRPPGE
jgi:hypothetical protein